MASKPLSEQDIRFIIRDELRQMVGLNQAPDIEWLPTAQAYQKLNYPSAASLREAVKNGNLRLGTEVQDRRSPESIYPQYYFNYPACVARLNTPPEKRSASS